MRLLSARIQNYRLHRDTSVSFARDLTVVGGRNETGKSTLAEAIHRALFLKSTTGGKVWEAMQSNAGSGPPEVELQFEAADVSWRLVKHFARGKGTTLLAPAGGSALRDDEAESRLAELMRVEEAGGGKGGANKALAQWAHLWVWQGSGGNDPSEDAAPHRDALLSRLEEQGGGAALQSDLDARVASRFQEACDEIFTRTGTPRAGSDLLKIEQEHQAALESLARAEAARDRLKEAAKDVRNAGEILATGERELTRIAAELERARQREKKAAELRHRTEAARARAREAGEAALRFQRDLEEVERLESELKQLAATSDSEETKALEQALEEARERAREASQNLETVESELEGARDRREWSAAWARLLALQVEGDELEKRREEIAAWRKRRDALDEELSGLPDIDERAFTRLQSLDEEATRAAAVLEAMSTGIEILEAKEGVEIGEETLAAGDSRILDRETVVTTGDGHRFRISPGGGSRLEEARADAGNRATARDRAFRDAGVASLAEAGEVRGRRSVLESERQDLRARLTAANAGEIDDEIARVSHELAAAEKEAERRSPDDAEVSPPTSLEEARRLRQSTMDAVAPLESRLEEAKKARRAAAEATEAARAELDELRQARRKAENERIEKQARLDAKAEPLGAKEQRNAKRDELEKAKSEAEGERDRVESELAALQPETIEADIERLTRAETKQRELLDRARQTRAAAESQLRNDGTLDPAADLARARARAESVAERFEAASRRGQALRRLRDRFAEEQQRLSDRFSRPLADAVTAYLQRIFGPDAKAGVSVDDGAIGNWTMTRGDDTFRFADLSGGAREQVAGAVRLALAELLAPEHGGHLPVVFDDAFTHSDPERVRGLQGMLDLAAHNGLQVILLTCTPADYALLGAETVNLDQTNDR